MLGCIADMPGRPNAEVADEFERRTGERVKPHNVSQFRQSHGLTMREGRGKGRPLPVGTVRVRKDGLAWVKVAEEPSRPGLRDNWRYLHVAAWEEAHGRALPEGWVVMVCDHDPRNTDPSNLLAVPREVVGVMNGLGVGWHDLETAEAAKAMAELRMARARLLASMPRRCLVCGAEFTPPPGLTATQSASRCTCPECCARGRKGMRFKRGRGDG